YLYGRVVTKAMAKLPHSLLQTETGYLLRVWAKGGGKGVVVTEQRCILTLPGERHVQLPDVAWFSKRPETQDGNAVSPPDLAVEILSPDDPFSRVNQKIYVYLHAGVKVVWVVDPEARNVSVYRREQVLEVIEGDAVLEDPVLPGFRV